MTPIPPALGALDAHPYLRRQVWPSLEAQARRIAERVADSLPRPELTAALDARIRSLGSGLIALYGPPGAGATSLICHLASSRPYPFWLPGDGAGAGLEALCAQLLALYDLPMPIVPPAAGRDATTLERLLDEAAARHSDQPIVVLIDQLPDDQTLANPRPFPTRIPRGVVVVYACGLATPPAGATRLDLPLKGTQVRRRLIEAALRYGCAPGLAAQLATRAAGSLLYVRLASGLLRNGTLRRDALPATLDALLNAWWQRLGERPKQLACALAAASQPLPVSLWAAVSDIPEAQAQAEAETWGPLLELRDQQVALYHAGIRTFITQRSNDNLASAHAAYVAQAITRSGGQFERLSPTADSYLMRHLARHLALSASATRAASPVLISRAWMLAQERRTGDIRAVAEDAAWLLRAAASEGSATGLVRAAALAGTLTSLGRTMPVDGLVDAFITTLARREPREATLRRAQALIDQLPGGRDKALALRRLGEACHEHGMRAPAMRMLSAALDLEMPGLPRAWRDEREETLVAFARAATASGAPNLALGITTRITHAERRGLIETEVVRWLLARGALTRAEEVAYAIGHAHTHEWAMAEVAVGHARAANHARAAEVLSTLKTPTAVAWARAELACDIARQGDLGAIDQVAQIPNPRLRDRALAQVASALVSGGQPAAAISVAHQIEDGDVQARALIDMAMLQPPNARTALVHAADQIGAIDKEERPPLIMVLAAACAALGDIEEAFQTARLLAEEEERDRAYARIAVALGHRGDHTTAARIAAAISDEDERFWACHELARLVGEVGDWQAAGGLAAWIGDLTLRARAEADLCIMRARAGQAAVAMAQASLIVLSAERVRAYSAIAESLVQQGGAAGARSILAHLAEPDARSRYSAVLAAALAANGDGCGALELAETITRPIDRARALIRIAQSTTLTPEQALEALGQGLRVAASLGRSETFACLAVAAPTLAALDGPEVLLAAAHALDEVDAWWG